jgi:hypothetical protein
VLHDNACDLRSALFPHENFKPQPLQHLARCESYRGVS